jgi:tetratricopeptide (TPR) repeat protein
MYIMAGVIVGSYTRNKLADEKPYLSKPVAIVFIVICLVNLLVGFAKNNFEVQWMLASGYEQNSRYPEMLEEAEKGKNSFVSLSPGGFPMELKTADALMEMKQYDRALQEIDRGAKYNPNSALVWNCRGSINARMGKLEASLSDFQTAKNLTPHSDMILKNLAMNYFILKQYKECLATLEEVDISNDSRFQSVKSKAQNEVANSNK